MEVAELNALYTRISNWGRWGPEDQRGTLNHITPETVHAAAQEVRLGLSTGCGSIDLSRPQPNGSPGWEMLRTGADDTGADFFIADSFGLAFHGPGNTHIDALSHCLHNGLMYNGRPGATITAAGTTSNDIRTTHNGIITRGILVDIPRLRGERSVAPHQPISPDEIEAALALYEVTPRPGDALLIYSGREQRLQELGPESEHLVGGGPMAGLDVSCLEWIHHHDIAVLCSDGGSDAIPSGLEHMRLPIHIGCLVYLGMTLIDNARLEDLAQRCRDLDRGSFLFTVQPLQISGGTGSPVHPVAVL